VETNNFRLFLWLTEDHAPKDVVIFYGRANAHFLVVSRQDFLSMAW